MKKLNITFLLSMLMSMVGLNTSAHDIEVKNADGVTIYYNYINNNTELVVTSCSYNKYAGSIIIPASVIYEENTYKVSGIGYQAFYGCLELTDITLPNSITYIEDFALYGCTGLTSLTIPNSVTNIGDSAFRGCSGLASIKVQEGNSKYDSRNNCNAIIETMSNYLILGCKNTTIPSSVNNIGVYAFENCSGLTSLTIPNSVTNIGGYAFKGCSGLTSVTIPNSVTSLGMGGFVFSGCFGLTSITIPNSVKRINEYTFKGCSKLASVTLPNSVWLIGEYAFGGCSGLTSITIPCSVTTIGNYAFRDCDNLKFIYALSEFPAFVSLEDDSFPISQSHFKSTLFVKKGLKELYSQADGWKNFIDIREMTDEQYEELVKKTNGEGETAVKDVSASNINEAKYYSLDGKQLTAPQKGLNILKMSDGTTWKVVK